MIQIKLNMLDKDADLYYFYGFFKAANDHHNYINRKDAAQIGEWILAAQERTIKALTGCSFDTVLKIISDTTKTVNYLLGCVERGNKLCPTI